MGGGGADDGRWRDKHTAARLADERKEDDEDAAGLPPSTVEDPVKSRFLTIFFFTTISVPLDSLPGNDKESSESTISSGYSDMGEF